MQASPRSSRNGFVRPPGYLPVVGHLLPAARDFLGALDRWAEEVGEIYRIDLPGRHMIMVNRPDEIERILVHQQHFVRSIDAQRARDIVGDGLLTTDGEVWRRRRHMMQPAFHRQRVAAYGDRMVHVTEATLAAWAPGDVRDMHREAMTLTLKIATDTLFGDDEVPPAQVGEAMNAVIGRFDGVKSLLPTSVIHVVYPRFAKAIASLDEVVYGLIARRRADPQDRHDLLSILLGLKDEDNQPMSDRELRDEMLTLLAASHETTANALSWAWYLLSRHPDAERKVLDEASALPGPPTAADMSRLPYTSAVVSESLRLFPPAWVDTRQVADTWEIDGCRIPTGLQVYMGAWVVHRDKRFYAEPLRFLPERWLDGSLAGNPTYAYFPFGGGQRLCIGRSFALLELPLVLSTVARHYRLRAVSDAPIPPIPSFTLRPRGGVPLRLERR